MSQPPFFAHIFTDFQKGTLKVARGTGKETNKVV